MADSHSTSTVVRRGAAPAKRAWGPDLALIAPTLLLVFGAVFDYGAARPEAGVFWAALQCAWAAAVFAYSSAKARPAGPTVLQIAAGLLFAALIAWTVATALPLGGLGPLVPPASWGAVGGAGALSIVPAATMVEAFKLLGLGAMFCTGWLLALEEQRAERMATLLLWFGGAYAFWAFGAFIADSRTVLGAAKSYHFERLTGSFMSANTAGDLFGVLAAAAWIAAMQSLRQHLRGEHGLRLSRPLNTALSRMALTAFFWVALLFTVSRAAMVATAACLIVVTAVEISEELTRRRAGAGKILGYTAPVVLAMLVLFAATVGQRFVERIPALGADSGERGAIFKTYIEAANQAPIAGYGLGSFQTINAGLLNPENFRVLWNLGAAHNVYLQWRIEGGLIGAVLMGVVLACLLIDIGARRIAGRSGRTRAAVALTASALLLIHNTVDYSIQVPAVAALWALLLGLGASPATARAGAPVRRSRSGSGRGSGQRQGSLEQHELQGQPPRRV